MPEKPFDQPFRPDEIMDGQSFDNEETINRTEIKHFDGQSETIYQEFKRSIPDENGIYRTENKKIFFADRLGTVAPIDPNNTTKSHTGLYITNHNDCSLCYHWLHPENRSNIIKLGYDGRLTQNGPICSVCYARLRTIQLVLTILGLGVFSGIIRGFFGF